MKNETVTCDGCGRDLTETGNSIDYRLVLANQTIPCPQDGRAVTDMMIYPPIKASVHFCGLVCLNKWLGRGDNPRCGTCAYWTAGVVKGREFCCDMATLAHLGGCECPVFRWGYGVAQSELPIDGALIEDDEGWGMIVGKSFGCIHHTERQDVR